MPGAHVINAADTKASDKAAAPFLSGRASLEGNGLPVYWRGPRRTRLERNADRHSGGRCLLTMAPAALASVLNPA